MPPWQGYPAAASAPAPLALSPRGGEQEPAVERRIAAFALARGLDFQARQNCVEPGRVAGVVLGGAFRRDDDDAAVAALDQGQLLDEVALRPRQHALERRVAVHDQLLAAQQASAT